jgi:cytochrome c oxidase assembly factor CtaG
MLVSSLVIALGLYGLGVVRVWRRAGYGRGVLASQTLAFGAGWLTLVIALSPPLDEWSEAWLVAHMVQHELLMVVAAPLIAFAAPVVALLWAMPVRVRRPLVDTLHRPRLTHTWSVLTAPPVVFLIYALALWVWHLPRLYDYALEHEAMHVVQHLCFFGTATLFWWGITHGPHGRSGYGAAIMYIFATALHGGVLGALMTFAPRVWYAPYLVSRAGGLTPLEDQQLAGLLMWVPASLTFVAGALVLFAAWLRQSDRLSRYASKPVLRPTGIR